MGMPHISDHFGSVFGYDYSIHKWVYDVKFYLSGNHWCFDKEGNRTCRTIDEDELKIIDKYNGVVEEHERENAAWLAHKQCRKRSCVCKKCEKYCHCYDCVKKINKCNQLCQSKGYKMKKQKLYTVTKPNSDHSIKVGDIIWLSQNGDLNNVTAKGWLQSNEWDIKGCNDFETTECTTHRLEICEGAEKVIKL